MSERRMSSASSSVLGSYVNLRSVVSMYDVGTPSISAWHTLQGSRWEADAAEDIKSVEMGSPPNDREATARKSIVTIEVVRRAGNKRQIGCSLASRPIGRSCDVHGFVKSPLELGAQVVRMRASRSGGSPAGAGLDMYASSRMKAPGKKGSAKKDKPPAPKKIVTNPLNVRGHECCGRLPYITVAVAFLVLLCRLQLAVGDTILLRDVRAYGPLYSLATAQELTCVTFAKVHEEVGKPDHKRLSVAWYYKDKHQEEPNWRNQAGKKEIQAVATLYMYEVTKAKTQYEIIPEENWSDYPGLPPLKGPYVLQPEDD